MKLAVYTANFGGKDVLQPVNKEPGVDYFYFTDSVNNVDPEWTKIFVFPFADSPRRTARWFKANSHILFREYDYTIWVDTRIRLLRPIQDYIDLLGDNHIATKKHPKRDCIYEEAEKCIEYKLDKESIIKDQIKQIKYTNYPEHNGLAETGLLIRDNSETVKQFNTLWATTLIGNSLRDQLSFDYYIWALKQKYSIIPKEYLKVGKHLNGN